MDGSFAGTTDAARTQYASMTTTLENDKLVISGHHEGNQSAQVYNVLYTGLNIPVTENTRLVYNITPQQPLPNNKYDYDFYSMHLAVDLKFDDGTYLSSTGLEDENGVRADPNSQGEGKAMLYAQENQILIQLGALKGKTIEKIDIGYANSADLKADGGDFKGTLNSIRIENVAPLNYDKEVRFSPEASPGLWSQCRMVSTSGHRKTTPATRCSTIMPVISEVSAAAMSRRSGSETGLCGDLCPA